MKPYYKHKRRTIMNFIRCALLTSVLAISGIISGCSVTPLDQSSVNLQTQAYNAKISCYDRLRERDIQINSLLATIPKDQVALVFVLNQMQENNKQLMAIATGHSADPCSIGTTAFDVQIAEVKAKNHAVEVVGGDVTSLGKWITGTVAVSNVSSDLSKGGASSVSTTEISGDNNNIVSSSSTLTNGNTLSEGATITTTPTTDNSNTVSNINDNSN
jgi:hypothetical protein